VLPARLLRRCVLRITLIAGGIRSRCRHPLGAGRSLNRLGPTSSDLAPYRVCDLIKRQHKSLENCLAEWGIEKVFTITVDNASANNNTI
jgi:hypothetical protein